MLKSIKLLGAVAFTSVFALGTAVAAPSAYQSSFFHSKNDVKQTSSKAKYKSTKLRPYDGYAAPQS